MARTLNYYIGERVNPQTGTYYIDYGQLTKKEATKKESPLYGSIFVKPYETEEAYNNEIKLLKSQGFRVYKR